MLLLTVSCFLIREYKFVEILDLRDITNSQYKIRYKGYASWSNEPILISLYQ